SSSGVGPASPSPTHGMRAVPAEHLSDALYALPSAACYGVYLFLQDTALSGPAYVTTSASCFRNEVEYVGFERLWGFTMREIVCVGDLPAVQDHLSRYKALVTGFAASIGLPLEVKAATDPFYDRSGSRAKMQEKFPVKEELVHHGLALGSLNFHR